MNVYSDPWLIAANAAILNDRKARGEPQMPVRTWEWPAPAERDAKKLAAGRLGVAARKRRKETP